MTLPPDYYQILNIPPTASDDQIKQAYRKLVKKYHPDVNRAPSAAEKFKEVQTAYDTLINPASRAAYSAAPAPSAAKPTPPVTHPSTTPRPAPASYKTDILILPILALLCFFLSRYTSPIIAIITFITFIILFLALRPRLAGRFIGTILKTFRII